MSTQQDALVVLEDVAQSLKASAEAASGGSDYDRGRLMGYYEALSTLLSQCAVAGISPDAAPWHGVPAGIRARSTEGRLTALPARH